jgi:hypothetical protein
MPFTAAHPLLVLPLRRIQLPLSALVIGSIMPDFEYFITWTNNRGVAHTIPGILVFCLPLGLIIFAIVHSLVKYPLLSLFPAQQQRKLFGPARSFKVHSIDSVAAVVAAILIGIVSHFIWDSFTHQTGFTVQRVPLLQATLIQTQWLQIKLYKLLQHASTIVGVAVLSFLYLRWYRSAVVKDIPVFLRFASTTKVLIVSVMLCGAIFSGSIYGVIESRSLHGYEKIRMFSGMSVISGISVLLKLLLIYSIIATVNYRSKCKNNLV